MKYNEAEQSKQDQNRDAWYGMVHVKSGSLLHQKSTKHYFRGTPEPDIFVPMPSVDDSDDGMHASLTKRILKICSYVLTGLLVVGVFIWYFGSV